MSTTGNELAVGCDISVAAGGAGNAAGGRTSIEVGTRAGARACCAADEGGSCFANGCGCGSGGGVAGGGSTVGGGGGGNIAESGGGGSMAGGGGGGSSSVAGDGGSGSGAVGGSGGGGGCSAEEGDGSGVAGGDGGRVAAGALEKGTSSGGCVREVGTGAMAMRRMTRAVGAILAGASETSSPSSAP